MSTRSHVIPTPGIENLSNNFLIQLMIKERVRCHMQNDTFPDMALGLVRMYSTVPPAVQRSVEQTEKWQKSEAKELRDAFKRYEEETSNYAQAMRDLAPYAGMQFEIVSCTYAGFVMLITVPDPES